MRSGMSRKEFVQEMIRGTELIVEGASGSLGIRQFIASYDNFYHYNALDGHEADSAIASHLVEFADACRLHEAVQTEVIDQVYLGHENLEQYVAAGRILPDEASDRLREIAETHDAAAVLKKLRAV